MHVKVVAQWTPSVSPEVAFVEAVWSLDGVDETPVSLSPDVTTAESPFGDSDGKTVGLRLTVVGNNGQRSKVVSAEVDVDAHPTELEPVTNLVLNVVPA